MELLFVQRTGVSVGNIVFCSKIIYVKAEAIVFGNIVELDLKKKVFSVGKFLATAVTSIVLCLMYRNVHKL